MILVVEWPPYVCMRYPKHYCPLWIIDDGHTLSDAAVVRHCQCSFVLWHAMPMLHGAGKETWKMGVGSLEFGGTCMATGRPPQIPQSSAPSRWPHISKKKQLANIIYKSKNRHSIIHAMPHGYLGVAEFLSFIPQTNSVSPSERGATDYESFFAGFCIRCSCQD